MLYGIIGAHRSGKTTTARRVANDLGIEFVDSSFGTLAKEFGFDPVMPMELNVRLDMQMKALAHHLNVINEASRPAVTDRTPLDFISYMLAECTMHSAAWSDAETLAQVHRYVECCLEMTIKFYDMVFLLDPLPVYAVDPTKPTPDPNPAFQTHIEFLIAGALARIHDQINWATIPVMSLDSRVETIVGCIVERMNDIDDLKKEAGVH